jgi:ABC-2 type transport system ATP-binding protein
MIVAENLSKFYSGHKAISGISFNIKEGEIVGLLGLNGAGKSTILKILGCFLLPSGGSAKVAGHSVDGDPQAIRKVIGYLPDTPPPL